MFNVIDVTLTSSTVISQLAFKLLSCVDVAVIKLVPTPTDVTFPVLSTVATLSLLLVQFTLWDILLGVIVAFKFTLSPIPDNVYSELFNDIYFVGKFIVTLQIALFPLPSFALAIIIPLPLLLVTVTFPVWSTTKLPGFVLSHVTSLFVAFSGNTVAFNCNGVLFVNV